MGLELYKKYVANSIKVGIGKYIGFRPKVISVKRIGL